MSGTLAALNALPPAEAEAEFLSCCGSRQWARAMTAARPFETRAALLAAADRIWAGLGEEDWLEAFRAHPRIGERKAASPTGVTAAAWSEREQAGVRDAGEEVRARLARGNVAYEEKFGHVFLICATGLSADTILEALQRRIENDAATELRAAAEEQRRITRLRLEKLLER